MRFTKVDSAGVNQIQVRKAGFYERLIDYVFKPMDKGELIIDLPDGHVLSYGKGQDGPQAKIKVLDMNFFKRCVLFGDIGFAESYMSGEWVTTDLSGVIEWMIINVKHHPTLMDSKEKFRPVNLLKIVNNSINLLKINSLKGSRRNIAEHYDLSNHFYKLLLDESMTYSCAYFRDTNQTLAQAQVQKYEEICRKIRVKSTDHVLEIGSGWGGFAIHLVKNYGCRVTAVTISQKQYEYFRQKIDEEKLSQFIDLELRDYRLLTGKYDKIVSIEMIEAVGHHFLPVYFKQCQNLLQKNGILLIQAILCPDHRYRSFRKNMDFIQKHIFPGSLLPSFQVMHNAIKRTGELNLVGFYDMTTHYTETLRHWAQNFNSQLVQVEELGFDQAFIRKWNYYLSYCQAAFKTRNISVAQIVFSHPNNLSFDVNQ